VRDLIPSASHLGQVLSQDGEGAWWQETVRVWWEGIVALPLATVCWVTEGCNSHRLFSGVRRSWPGIDDSENRAK
jgi:hypothetical protein